MRHKKIGLKSKKHENSMSDFLPDLAIAVSCMQAVLNIQFLSQWTNVLYNWSDLAQDMP